MTPRVTREAHCALDRVHIPAGALAVRARECAERLAKLTGAARVETEAKTGE